MRLTQDGMPVKSCDVPEVVAITVPDETALAAIVKPDPSVLLVSVWVPVVVTTGTESIANTFVLGT